MPKIAKPLGALKVKLLTEPKMHPVGTVPGLMLNISSTGAKSWILRTMVGAKRSDIGLGSYPAITLAAAWDAARVARAQIRSGIDPVAQRRALQTSVQWTFKRCALAYIEGHKESWKNAKHEQQWRNTLETYVYPKFGEKHVRTVAMSDVIDAIEPHWTTKNETMVRVRNRIDLVLAWAGARGYRDKENPARWRGNLDQVLPKPSKVNKVNKRESFEAVPIDDMHDFMKRLRAAAGMSARTLEFAILTAADPGRRAARCGRRSTWPPLPGASPKSA